MNILTINKLNQINIDFYNKVAPYFDSSRQYSWNGWEKLWDFIILNTFPVYSILDIGCGNGRFYKFLQEKINLLCMKGNLSMEYPGSILKNKFRYLGIDNNDFLLEKAKKEFKKFKNAEFAKVDLIEGEIPSRDDGSNIKYDIVTIFGVMHHIPSYNNRLNILKKTTNLLNRDGIICISFWQFMKDEREKKKVLDWNDLDIDKEDLEENDYLLSWKRGVKSQRYCHFANDEEIKKLVDDSGLKIIEEYAADGKNENLNKYVILTNK